MLTPNNAPGQIQEVDLVAHGEEIKRYVKQSNYLFLVH